MLEATKMEKQSPTYIGLKRYVYLLFKALTLRFLAASPKKFTTLIPKLL